jgi:hypothetical protein
MTHCGQQGCEKVYKSLRLVIGLHTAAKTGPNTRGKSGLRARCTECGFAYPCPTIEAIEKELK